MHTIEQLLEFVALLFAVIITIAICTCILCWSCPTLFCIGKSLNILKKGNDLDNKVLQNVCDQNPGASEVPVDQEESKSRNKLKEDPK